MQVFETVDEGVYVMDAVSEIEKVGEKEFDRV